MPAPAIPLIYYGIGILLAGGASVVAFQEYADEDIDLGRIDLDGLLGSGGRDPDPDPEIDVASLLVNTVGMAAIIDAQLRARERVEEDDCEDCQECKPAKEGNDVNHIFQAGTVRKPSPRGLGSLYQHYVVPWFSMRAWEQGGKLSIDIGEWEWQRGRAGSWDGMDFVACKLIEVKLGYRDFLDPARVGQNSAHMFPNPRKPFLGTLDAAFRPQLSAQVPLVRAAGPPASLEWVFSDREVNWQFLAMCTASGYYDVGNRVQGFPGAPNGTEFVRELYQQDDGELYGYWRTGA